MHDLDFTDRRVLVVGGSSGIGNGVAQEFRRRGAEVHVWGTRPSASDYEGVEGCDLTGLGYSAVDVSDRDAIAAAPGPSDRLDVLVLCQGAVLYGRAEFAPEGWDRVMAVNLHSLLPCCQRFQEALAAAGGSIVIISSVSGLQANKGNPAYAASKAGAISLTRTLGQAWATEGIRVNGVAPGLVDTKMTKVTTQHPRRLQGVLDQVPLARIGTPADIAGAVLFLASPLAGYVTGQTIVVDGGLTL